MVANCIEFYNELLKRFDRSKLGLSHFVNPIFNHADQFPDVQFLNPNGTIAGRWNSEATDFYIADPLEGPFYRLPVAGLIFLKRDEESFWNDIAVVVKISDTQLLRSCGIEIYDEVDVIWKELGDLVDNKWYLEMSDGQLVQAGRI